MRKRVGVFSSIHTQAHDSVVGLGAIGIVYGMSSLLPPEDRLPSLTHHRVLAILGLMTVLAVIYLRWQGRVWWCECGRPFPVSIVVQSEHNSQHLFDAYSLSHVLHGVLFFGLFWLIPNLSLAWRFILATTIEIGWELLENSPIVIDRYRQNTASLGYTGDSIANSLADIVSYAAGFLLARWLGLWKSVAAFVLVEITMVLAMRDNLSLNVLMLLWPIEAVKQWQTGG